MVTNCSIHVIPIDNYSLFFLPHNRQQKLPKETKNKKGSRHNNNNNNKHPDHYLSRRASKP
jgi:hypothetical protein